MKVMRNADTPYTIRKLIMIIFFSLIFMTPYTAPLPLATSSYADDYDETRITSTALPCCDDGRDVLVNRNSKLKYNGGDKVLQTYPSGFT